MVISGREQKDTGVSEPGCNKRHDKRDRKLNETKAKSVVRHLGEEVWGSPFSES